MKRGKKQHNSNIPSPCIGVCCLDQNSICVGCNRSQDEIRNWLVYTDSEKQNVLHIADLRKKHFS